MSSQSKLSEKKIGLDDDQKSDLQDIENSNLLQNVKEDLEDSFEMVKDLQNILKNCSNLTNEQKSDYCKSQRYFMKLYLQNLHKNP